MSENETRTVKNLRKRVDDQSLTVERMRSRISDLTDELTTIKTDIANFKKYVASDITTINDFLQKNQN